MAQRRHVDAELVRAPRARREPQIGQRVVLRQHFIFGLRRQPVVTDAAPDDGALRAADGQVDRAALRHDAPRGDGAVLAAQPLSVQRDAQPVVDVAGLGGDEQAARALVEPAHEVRGGAVAEVGRQRGGDIGRLRFRAARVHGDVRGFVDDQQVVILIDDIQRQITRGKLLSRAALGEVDRYNVTGADNGVDMGGGAVEQNGVLPPFEALEQGVGELQLAAQDIAQGLIVPLRGYGMGKRPHKITALRHKTV